MPKIRDAEKGELTVGQYTGNEALPISSGSSEAKYITTETIGLASLKPWSKITGTPTTLSGYGITDLLAATTSLLKGAYYASNSASITDHTVVATSGSIAYCLAQIGSTVTALVLPPGIYNIGAALTIPSNVTLVRLPGAVLTRTAGDHLTINGPFECVGGSQCFSDNSTGHDWVVLAAGSCQFVTPDMWGSSAGCVHSAVNAVAGKMPVRLNAKTYPLGSETLEITVDGTEIMGIAKGGDDQNGAVVPRLTFTGEGPNTKALYIHHPADNDYIERICLENFTVEVADNTKYAIYAWAPGRSLFDGLKVTGNKGGDGSGTYGMFIGGSIDFTIRNCDIQGAGATGDPAQYCEYGICVSLGVLNAPATTTRVEKCYIHYNRNGIYLVGSFVTFLSSVIESNYLLAMSHLGASADYIDCWFENNSGILSVNTFYPPGPTRIIGGVINTYAVADILRRPRGRVIIDGSAVSSSATPLSVMEYSQFTGAETKEDLFLTFNPSKVPSGTKMISNLSSVIGWDLMDIPFLRTREVIFSAQTIAAATAYNMTSDDIVDIPVTSDCSVVAVDVYYSTAMSAGYYDLSVKKNGSGLIPYTALGAFSNTTQRVHFDFPPWLYELSVGDTLGAYFHTNAAFAATGGNAIFKITLLCES